MRADELKKMIIMSLESDPATGTLPDELEEAGVTYRFKDDFAEMIMKRLEAAESLPPADSEFFINMRLAFYRVALTGIAAIILLLISMLLGQGTLSFDSILGLGDLHDESIICLLTGN